LITVACIASLPLAALADPLPSWTETGTKSRIVDFISSAAHPNSDGFIPEVDRIAAFDNDGTLWAEQPSYFQLIFAITALR